MPDRGHPTPKAAGAILSMVLFIVELAAQHVNPRWAIAFVLVQLMLPPRARDFMNECFRHGPLGVIIRDVEAAFGAGALFES